MSKRIDQLSSATLSSDLLFYAIEGSTDVKVATGGANGIAYLDATGLITAALLGSGSANNTVFLRGDQTYANWLNGPFGLGTSSTTGYGIHNSLNITGASSSFGQVIDGSVQNDVTGIATIFYSHPGIASGTALNTMHHFFASQGTYTGTVAFQYGFWCDAISGGTSQNVGFYSNVAANGSVNSNFYAAGTAPNFFAGGLGIGSAVGTGQNLRLAKTITGAVGIAPVSNEGQIQSDVTTQVNYYSTTSSTQATSFTLGTLRHYQANQGNFGAGSAVTAQYGFSCSAMAGATSNFGFWSNIAVNGSNNYNFYANGTAPNFFTGYTGIGVVPIAGNMVYASIAGTSGTGVGGFVLAGAVQSGTTSSAVGFNSNIGTAAAAFTLSNLYHIRVQQSTIGAGSAVTTQYGVRVDSSMTGATTNYAFYSDLAVSGTNRWNFYANGTAPNYMGGSLGLNSTSLTAFSFRASNTLTGSTTATGIYCDGQIQSDVTGSAIYFNSASSTQATSFNVGTIKHFYAQQGTIGAGSSATHQYGFFAESSLTGATDNYGFYGNLAVSGVARYNFYAAGTAPNFFNGYTGIGVAPLASTMLGLSMTGTSATGVFGANLTGNIPSGATTSAIGYGSNVGTTAAAFTVPTFSHFRAVQNTIGAGSAITTQRGFEVDSSLSGATTNYGFYGNIAVAGTARWNFYAAGTAPNFFAGSLGLNSTSLTGFGIRNSLNITGAVGSIGVASEGIIQSDVTSSAAYYRSFAATQATSFTLTDLQHYKTQQGTIGAGSTVTNQYGYYVDSTLTGATNNYGFYGNIASGSNRWNAYMTGTAANYFAGQVSIGTNTLAASALLNVSSTTLGFLKPVMTATQRAAITSPAAGLAVYDSSVNLPYYFDGTNWNPNGAVMAQNSQSAAYGLVIADSGKQIFHPAADTTARTFTIPANSSVAYTVGTTIEFVNQAGAGTLTIAITTDTMTLVPTGTTGSRTLAANGVAWATKITATNWIIYGYNLT